MARFYEGGGLNAGGGGLPENVNAQNPGTTPMGSAATGAAAGSAAGPYGAIIGALAGLMGGLLQQKDAEKARKLAYEQEQKRSAQDRQFGMQNRQIQTAGEMGNREQSAIQQLMGVFARSAR